MRTRIKTVEQIVVQCIQENCALDEAIVPESKLSDISIDSLSFVAALIKLEETFETEFDLEKLNIENWNTVGDIITMLEEKENDEE